MPRRLSIAVLASTALVACTHTPPGGTASAPSVSGTPVPGFTSSNPFARASTLPYEAPLFDRIHNEDYQPALEEGMRAQLAEIQAIANNTADPTFDNTIGAMERSGQLLTRTAKAFFGVVGANTNDTLQKVQEIEAPKLAAHSDAINLDAKLFQRVKSLHDRRDALGLNAEQIALVNRYYRDFVRAGALLSPADKERMRALNAEESKLTTQFQSKLLAATKAGAVVVDDRSELAGLSDAEIAAAAEAAKERNLPGKYVIVLQNTTQHPLQTSLANRALRERLFNASVDRAEHRDSNDTRAVIARLAQLRADRARLLGFSSYAAYSLDTQGAKTPENAVGLLSKIADPATAKARGEAADMQSSSTPRPPNANRRRSSSRPGIGSTTPSRCVSRNTTSTRRRSNRTSS